MSAGDYGGREGFLSEAQVTFRSRPIQPHGPNPASEWRGSQPSCGQDAELPEDFDRVAVVVDWLDACRTRDLDALLDLYAEDARLECSCEGVKVLAAGPNWILLAAPAGQPAAVAFGLEEIGPEADGVVLDYRSFEGKPVRIHFGFDETGKIVQTRCDPSACFRAGFP